MNKKKSLDYSRFKIIYKTQEVLRHESGYKAEDHK